MKPTKPVIDFTRRPGLVRLIPLLESKGRGDTVTYDEIAKATGDNPKRYGQPVRKFFEAHGMVMNPIPNVGWSIGTAVEHIHKANKEHRSAIRKQRRRLHALVNTPREELPNREMAALCEHETLKAAAALTRMDEDRKDSMKRLKPVGEQLPRLRSAK